VASAWLVREVGSDAVQWGLVRAASFLPLLLVLEGGRIFCEAAATRRLVAELGGSVRAGLLSRAVLVCYSLTIAAPAGRTAGEAAKAAMLARRLGTARAAVVAAAMQALNLLTNGTVGAIAAVAAFSITGWSPLTGCLVAHALVHYVAGFGLQVLARHRGLARRVASIFPRLQGVVDRFAHASQRLRYVPRAAGWFMLASRALQALQLAILGHAVAGGFALEQALLGHGVYMLSTAVGDLVPAQLGVTDGAFVLAAGPLGIVAADAAAIGLVIHCIQLCWVVVGALVPLLPQPSPAPRPTESAGS